MEVGLAYFHAYVVVATDYGLLYRKHETLVAKLVLIQAKELLTRSADQYMLMIFNTCLIFCAIFSHPSRLVVLLRDKQLSCVA